MFSAVPMVRVRIQVPGREAAAATHAIARLGLLHLIDMAHGRTDAAPPGSLELLSAHRSLHDRVVRALERVGVDIPPLVGGTDRATIQDFDVERQRIEATLGPLEAAIEHAWSARSAASATAANLQAIIARADAIERGGVDLKRMLGLKFASVSIATAPETALASLSAFLSPTPHLIQPLEPVGGETLAVIAAPASARTRLDAALRLVHIETMDASAFGRAARPGDLENELRSANAAIQAASADLATLSGQHAETLRSLFMRAETCVLLLQAQARFGATGRFVVISGWIPEASVDRLRQMLAEVAPLAVMDVEKPGELAEAPAGIAGIPILHRNPVLLRPFQSLVEMYDTPSYGEVQPTAFFAVSFLLMFGLMFGDVGHGATLCCAGYYLFRYMPRFLDYGILLMEAGAASAAFGFLYGSFFGIEGALPVLWLEPVRDLPTFIRVAVTLGIVLVSGGLVLNVINSWRLGERASALFGMRGLFGAFLYWTALVLVARALMPRSVVTPLWLLGVLAASAMALVLLRRPLLAWLQPQAVVRPRGPRPPTWLRALEGSVELVDSLFAYMANTVSFIRIAAFAAVHAGVFVAMFAVSDTLAQARFGGALSIGVLILGNIVLILLEGLTVSVQVLRLEYYEFFGKFFRGGGQAYRPLMLRTNGARGGRS